MHVDLMRPLFQNLKPIAVGFTTLQPNHLQTDFRPKQCVWEWGFEAGDAIKGRWQAESACKSPRSLSRPTRRANLTNVHCE